MPEFANPFAGNRGDRPLSRSELVRAIRFSIAAEYEAIQLYMQLAESVDDALAKKVLVDIANEEREHAGEFLKLLHHLDPDEEKFYQHGYEEVEEMMEEMGVNRPES
jgi:rubrerythrin